MRATPRTVGLALKEKLIENKGPLGIEDVFYGDQQKYPRYPAIAVQPDTRQSQLTGTQYRATSTISVLILIYHGQLVAGSLNQEEADKQADEIAELIHSDPDLGGLIVHGFVATAESGTVQRGNTPVRASRLTYQATAKEHLP